MRTFTVTGLARFGGVDSLGGATIAVFDIPTARTVLGKTGFDAIQVAAAPGVCEDRAGPRDRARCCPRASTSRPATSRAPRDKATISEAITFIRGFLLAFGGIALFVGAFVIFNTLSITVAQRSRELATLRTLGASRRQVLRSVIAEAAIIGLVASRRRPGRRLRPGQGPDAPCSARWASTCRRATRSSPPRTVVVSLLVGTLVTLLAGVVPAIRATRVPPIAAVREGAQPPAGAVRPLHAGRRAGHHRHRRRPAGARAAGRTGSTPPTACMSLGVGTLALFVGVAMISSALVRPIAAVVGWPIARLRGASGALARENAVRNPSRTAATAAALMIGLALVTFVSVLGTGLVGTARSDIREQVCADYVVTSSSGWETISPGVARAIAADAPGSVVSSVRQDRARVNGSAEDVSGVDPATIAARVPLHLERGLGGRARHPRRRRRDRRPQLRRRPRPGDGRPRADHQPLRGHHDAHRDRHRRPAAAQPAARRAS